MSVLSFIFFFFFLILDFCFPPILDSVQCMKQYKGPPGLIFFVDFLKATGVSVVI